MTTAIMVRAKTVYNYSNVNGVAVWYELTRLIYYLNHRRPMKGFLIYWPNEIFYY